MLNIIWAGMILLSIVVAIFTGRLDAVASAAVDGAASAVALSIELLGIMCLWNGLMTIAEKSNLVEKISSCMRPLFRLLFPGLDTKSKSAGCILLNMTANFLGLGNAATPLGLQAMQSLQQDNGGSKTASRHMVMFVVLNTASFQLIPTTVISLRAANGSAAPSEIIIPVWIASAIAIIFGVCAAKFFEKTERP